MITGGDCKTYVNTGTYGSPTWSLMDRITSPKLKQQRGANARTIRGKKNKTSVLGKREYGISFTYTPSSVGASDAVLTKLQDSYTNRTVMDIAMMDRAIATSGSTGIRGPYVVQQFDRSEDDEDAVVYDVVLVEVEDSTIPETDTYTTT